MYLRNDQETQIQLVSVSIFYLNHHQISTGGAQKGR